MNEEIKDIIEILELAKEEIEKNDENITATLDLQDLKSLKNLYDLYNEEKEKNNDLEEENKEIIDYHYKNDSLLDLYNKEKEKNEKLKEENKELRKPKYIIDCKTNKVTKLTNDFVGKDKIREKILDLKDNNNGDNYSLTNVVMILKELLEERN